MCVKIAQGILIYFWVRNLHTSGTHCEVEALGGPRLVREHAAGMEQNIATKLRALEILSHCLWNTIKIHSNVDQILCKPPPNWCSTIARQQKMMHEGMLCTTPTNLAHGVS